MAWEIAFSVAFLTVCGVFVLAGLKVGETIDPLTKELTRSGKIFRLAFWTLALYMLVLALGGAQFAAEGNTISRNSTVINQYANYSERSDLFSCASGYFLNESNHQLCSMSGGGPSVNSTQSVTFFTKPYQSNSSTTTVETETNAKAAVLATSGLGAVLWVIQFLTALGLIGTILEFFNWFNEWREKKFGRQGR